MPVYNSFNPFNPADWMQAWAFGPSAVRPSIFEPQPRTNAPIEIDASSSDPGASMTAGKDSVTIRGRTEGAKVVRDSSGYVKYEVARGMGLSLDINKVPTTDIYGNTDFTMKNRRLFSLDTSPGMSAMACANALAAKVNDEMDFRARVVPGAGGSAKIEFTRF